MGRRLRIIALATVATLSGLAAAAPTANAAFHLMKVREVFPGTAANQNSAFVELQMYAGGQTQVASHQIKSYTTASNPLGTFTIPSNVANGATQRTILIGDTGVAGRDATYDMLGETIQPNAGGAALCFDVVDCVAWGSFASPAFLTSPAGNPVLPTGGIPNGSSITRRISPNCPTLLEAADDTNSSATDFAASSPTPRGNAVTPTEVACVALGGPDTTINKAPKKKVKSKKRKKKAKFTFSSDTPGATFECSVDGDAFEPCTSPFSAKVKRGKHEFAVRAVHPTLGTDASPADHAWKLKKKK